MTTIHAMSGVFRDTTTTGLSFYPLAVTAGLWTAKPCAGRSVAGVITAGKERAARGAPSHST